MPRRCETLRNVGRGLAIAGGENDRERGTLGARGGNQFAAGHAGHRLVGDQDRDIGMRAKHRERLVARSRLDYLVAEILEQRGGVQEDDRIVVDDEDAAASGLRRFGSQGFGQCGRGFLVAQRKPDMRARAAADLALHLQRAADLLRETMDHRQAEACALADTLRCEKGIGGARERRCIHARAIVGDRQPDTTWPGARSATAPRRTSWSIAP